MPDDQPDSGVARGKWSFDSKEYWDDRYREDISGATSGNVTVGRRLNEWSFRVRRRVVERALKRFRIDVSRSRVMELAFGAGPELAIWADRNAPFVLGIEVTQRPIDEARERYGARGWQFRRHDISEPYLEPGESGTFDLALAFSVLFIFVEDEKWRSAVSSLCAAVKPGGYVLFTDHMIQPDDSLTYMKMRPLEVHRAEYARHGVEILDCRPATYFTNSPHADAKYSMFVWKAVSKVMRLADRVGMQEVAGYAIGAALYWPDLLLTRFKKTGPSAHLIIGRKVG